MTGLAAWDGGDPLARRARSTPDRTALVDAASGREWTYADLDAAVDRLAAALGPGGPLGTLLDTRVELVGLVHAAFRVGRPLVPLDTALPEKRATSRARRAGVETVVHGPAFAETAADCPGRARPLATLDWAEEATDSGAAETAGTPPGPGETALVLFTSGTTGRPKGVRLTPTNLVWSAVASAFRLGVAPGDRWLCCLPMYHMGGLAPAVRTPLYGTTLVVQEGFDAERTGQVLADRGVTGVSLVPTQLRRLLDADWEPAPALSTVLLGGAPAGPDLLARALAADVSVAPTYGMTETASQVATATPGTVREAPESVGHPLVGTEVTVLADGEPAEPGTVGELVVAGPTVSPGYLDGEATAAAHGAEGLHTGDLGYRDERGRLYVVGRVDDAITTGGETVHPATVVDALREVPGVADAAVIGLPDEEWGERVAALVVPAEDRVTPAAVREVCRGRLPDYAVPKTVETAATLPRTASGTVDREAVRERLAGRQ